MVFPDEIEHLMALERLIRAWLRCRWRTRANRSEFRQLMIAPRILVVVAVGCTGDQAHTEGLENVCARSRRCWLRPRRGLPFGDERHALVGPSVSIGPTQLARW